MAYRHNDLQTENARLRKLLEQAGIDAAASDIAERLQKLLIAELHHRVKNLLSMVLSITTQTMRTASSLEAAQEAIHNRIMILSRSFDVVFQGERDVAPLSAIIQSAVEPYNKSNRVSVSVPRVAVAPMPALSMALVFNELCTNAVKYGALSQAGGAVVVVGTVSDDVLTVVWTEKGGPSVKGPRSRSFGTRMIASVIPEAQVDLDFQPTGLVCQMRVPLTALA